MRINKDLAEALLMLSAIVLILLGVSDFENESTKTVIMVTLGSFTAILFVLRVLAARQKQDQEQY